MPEITATKNVRVHAKTLKIYCKVSDRFTATLVDQDGEPIFDQDDGYVPGFMPGDHYGDYIILDIDLDDGSSNYHIYNNICLNGGLKLREGFYRTVENNIIINIYNLFTVISYIIIYLIIFALGVLL